ncbi:hypothetical protein QIH10_27345, partial [Klebsiella pneumoniae]|nr:hypothetical protein [Klebsiella pneumoniae]
MTLSVISAFLGLTILMGEISKIKKFKREDRFIDVEDNRDSRDQTFQKKILSELNSIKAKSDSFSTDNIEEIVSKAIES